ncbi:MAG: four helix bundle protein [Bacteroidales bacterium]|nr:four helix bundle protein [Bacteroidales bacterium]
MEDKVPSFFRFEDLRIYGKAVDYANWIIGTLREARTDNEKQFSHAFVNSAMDIALNIAEGSARSKTQFDHYLKISKTAIRECVVYTTVAGRMGLLTEYDAERSRELLMEQTRMIGALIISLQRGSKRPVETEFDHEEPAPDDMGFDEVFADDSPLA